MKEITVHIFTNETCIERDDSPEVILCKERVCKIAELRDIIKYFWRLDFGDYDLTTINYCLDTKGSEQQWKEINNKMKEGRKREQLLERG